MNKQQIDQYFTTNHQQIKDYIKKMYSKTQIQEEPDFFLSNCYLFINKKADKITSDKELKDYISNYIYKHTKWTNSNQRSEFLVLNKVKNERVKITTNEEDLKNLMGRADETELTQDDINDLIINEWYEQAPLVYKVIWEAYFMMGYNTLRKLARYFNVAENKVKIYLNEVKADIKLYYNNKKTI